MAVSVDVATYAGTAVAGVNYTPLDQVLSFAAGQDSQTVTIPVRNDGVVTPDLTASVVLSSPTSGVSLGTPSTMTLVIHNVDQNAGTTGTGSTSNPLVTPDRVKLVLNKKHQMAEILVGFSGGVDASEADSTATYRLATARGDIPSPPGTSGRSGSAPPPMTVRATPWSWCRPRRSR